MSKKKSEQKRTGKMRRKLQKKNNKKIINERAYEEKIQNKMTELTI